MYSNTHTYIHIFTNFSFKYFCAGKTHFFISSKSESLFQQRKNPRKIAWTVLYRRKHKKGLAEEASKKRTRRIAKFERTIAGVTAEKLKELRNQKPEMREAQRAQAIR